MLNGVASERLTGRIYESIIVLDLGGDPGFMRGSRIGIYILSDPQSSPV